MAWTTPGTAVAGDVLTAAFWNEQVRDNLNALDAAGANDVGLVLTKVQSVAAGTSSQVVSDCFTDEFAHYLIVCKLLGSVAGSAGVLLQLRTGSTTLAGSGYGTGFLDQTVASGGTFVETWTSTASSFNVGAVGNFTPGQTNIIELSNPKVAVGKTVLGSSGSWGSSTSVRKFITGRHADTGQYESMVISASSGTFGGTILVYGYKD